MRRKRRKRHPSMRMLKTFDFDRHGVNSIRTIRKNTIHKSWKLSMMANAIDAYGNANVRIYNRDTRTHIHPSIDKAKRFVNRFLHLLFNNLTKISIEDMY